MTKDVGRTSPENTVVTAVSPAPKRGDGKRSCLVVIVGSEIGKRVELGAENLVIGRSQSTDLQLDIDNVSRSHAAVVPMLGGYILRDLGSTNGTFVNDARVHEHPLRDGDQIRIGRAMLKFLTGGNVEAQYHEEIYRLMTLDGLTQVHNRRYFNEAMDKELARSKRYKHPFGLVLFDIDHFKRINDTHGHLAGDEVLRRVAQLVQAKVRTNDLVARIGGEEFAVILPEGGLDGAKQLAEKLRELIAEERFTVDGTHVPVTISLGAAEWHDGANTIDDMVKLADEKLYAAKRGGRNKVCW